MTNSEKLRALADWFDQYDANAKNDFDKISNEVQRDLRAMATEFEQLQQHSVSGSLPTPEQSKKAMLRKKTRFVDNMDKFSSRKNAYKQGWKDCYEWIMSQSNER